jgi:N-acetyl-1-D-myo-inositol-2-amino-2-deoxy-alpha-D-glucopyranoside deacetylase
MRETIVAVVAHPDDESLIAGGTLAMAAAAGAETGVVSLTRGESGPVAGTPLGRGESLGPVRERELRAAAERPGAKWAACLRNPDGELDWSDRPATARELAALLARRRRPTSVLTFGEDGLYWHPDHIAARAIAGMAVELIEQGGAARVWLYEAVWPAGRVSGLVAAARERGLPFDLWGLDPGAFGTAEDGPTVVVDVRPVLDRKLAALRAHRSQLGPDHLLTSLPDDLAHRFLGEEHWRVARRADSGDGPIGRLAAAGRKGGSDERR